MVVHFELPDRIEQALKELLGDANLAAKEAVLVELYRQGKIGRRDLSEALGLSRYATDGLLKRYNVTEDLLTVEDYEAQLRSFDRATQR